MSSLASEGSDNPSAPDADANDASEVTLGGVFNPSSFQVDNEAILLGIDFCIKLVNETGGIALDDGARFMNITNLSGSLSSITEDLCISPEEAQTGVPVETLVQQQIIEKRYDELVEMGTDALMGPYSSLLTTNASAAVGGRELFYATAAAAASLYRRGIPSFYGTLPRTQLYVSSTDIFPVLAQQQPSNRGGNVTFGLTFELTDTFGREACQATRKEIKRSGGVVEEFVSFSNTTAPGQNAFQDIQDVVLNMMNHQPSIDVFVLCGLAELYPQARGIFNTLRPDFKAGVFVGTLDLSELYDFELNTGWINTNLWFPSMPVQPAASSVQYDKIDAFTTPAKYNASFYEEFGYVPGVYEPLGSASCMLFVMASEMAGSIEREAVDAAMEVLDVTNFWGRNKMEDGPVYKNNNSGKKLNGIQFTQQSARTQEPLFIDGSNPNAIEYPAQWPWIESSDNVNETTLAIIFGVIGGVLLLIIVSVVAFFVLQRRHFRMKLAVIGKRTRKMPKPGEPACALVSDVQASTALYEADPTAMTTAMRVHNSNFRHILKRHYGFEKSTEGDSFTVLFHNVTDALTFATSLQRSFLELRWPRELYDVHVSRNNVETTPASVVYRNQTLIYKGLRVRMGIHYGPAGEAERVAKDVCDITRSGGQIVVTETAWMDVTSSQFPFEKKKKNVRLLEMCIGDGGGDEAGSRRKDKSYRSYRLQNVWTKSPTNNDPSLVNRKESVPLQVDSNRSNKQALYIECLGDVHIKHGERLQSIRLISVLPESLRERSHTFEPLQALQLSPGFAEAPNARRSPESYQAMSIVFIYVSGIETMLLTDERQLARDTMRQLEIEAIDVCLREFGGYKCEAFDTGFLLAFSDPRGAMAFSILVHKISMHIEWTRELLELEDFSELYVRINKRSASALKSSSKGPPIDVVTAGSIMSDADESLELNVKSFQESKLVLRGPRLRIGVYEGVPTECSPHPHTGRATYAGQLVNRAARIASKAPPGHTLASLSAWQSASRMIKEDGAGAAVGLEGDGIPKSASGVRNSEGERTGDESNADGDSDGEHMRTLTFESTVALQTALSSSIVGVETVNMVEVTAADLGSFRFKGVSETIEIVHVFDDVLYSRPFPVFKSGRMTSSQ